ncbi:MAG: recombination-associated protein RdgC [Thermodesulfobacteriota bacterium]|nr:recombination-associated protein RdgC [Thermodesulfobacteriota bacterium]
MGIYSGTVSFTRYFVEGDSPEPFNDLLLNKLREFAFKEIIEESEIEKSMGWVSVNNMFDTDFSDLNFKKGPFISFTLRVDTRTISPQILNAYLLKEELEYKKETQKERIYKKERDMLKDKVVVKLLKKIPVQPHLYDLCWALDKNILYLFSTSPKICDEFRDFFRKSFSLRLIPISPYTTAEKLINSKEGKEALENIEPKWFIK